MINSTSYEGALEVYLRDIDNSKPLSREKEVELSSMIKDGDVGARNELVAGNLRFVVGVAKGYQNRGMPFEDIISAGNDGLVTAAEKFDGTRGYKFITYAVWWIRQAILQTLSDQSRIVRLPLNKNKDLRDIKKATSVLYEKLGREPFVEEIADHLDTGDVESVEMLLNPSVTYSLDEFEYDTSREKRVSSVVDVDAMNSLERLEEDELKEKMDNILERLDSREQYIVKCYFGFDGGKEKTLEQIGRVFGITRERVRQLRNRALGKLNKLDLESLTEYKD
jgi:RNA polymerase primary sigma factor